MSKTLTVCTALPLLLLIQVVNDHQHQSDQTPTSSTHKSSPDSYMELIDYITVRFAEINQNVFKVLLPSVRGMRGNVAVVLRLSEEEGLHGPLQTKREKVNNSFK